MDGNVDHNSNTGRVRQRGGTKYSPLRIVQFVVALAVLVGSSIAFIQGALYGAGSGWLIGAVLLIIGCILPFIEIPEGTP